MFLIGLVPSILLGFDGIMFAPCFDGIMFAPCFDGIMFAPLIPLFRDGTILEWGF